MADTGIISEPYDTIEINFPGTVINITVEDVGTQEVLANTLIRSGEYNVIMANKSCR